ncbi:hypothetical protein IEQ44_10420 [Nocardioides sp. Y6]|uniref:Uncharacterized protein n=1 Tax=Nocardioides malaquae TaxID=2773426 RepID=A0ABR9RU00_9ACTN|nr:hypothetical protein [Nocardioides malaquae]MBE7325073.1 hypothetical protein [Nocardioides malaquae]
MCPTLRRRLARSVAVLLVGAAAGLGLAVAPPALAAVCSGDAGVTVVVDFAELGGGLTAGCDSDTEGQRARAILDDAGYPLTMASKSPGFVCRVSGLPADDPCVEAAPPDRYWSIWWADGEGGAWVYSSRGVDSLRVPDGGYLAMAWHEGSGKAEPPATVPVARSATPPSGSSPKPEPTRKSKPRPKPAPGTGPPAPGTGDTTAPDPSEPGASATEPEGGETSPSVTPEPRSTEVPTPGESVEVDPDLPAAGEITLGPDDAAPAAAQTPDGLPGWAVPVVLVVLAATGAVVVLRRRRQA